MAKSTAERRKESDDRKKKEGLYKPTVWVKRENGHILSEISKELCKDVRSYKIDRRYGKTSITIEYN